MTISVAITWILFLGLFPIAFFWLRRAWRILFKQDFSQVALKGGEPPADPAKYAPYAAAINLVAGAIAGGGDPDDGHRRRRVRHLDGDCRVDHLDEVLCRLYCQPERPRQLGQEEAGSSW
jgi:hypothetical protein